MNNGTESKSYFVGSFQRWEPERPVFDIPPATSVSFMSSNFTTALRVEHGSNRESLFAGVGLAVAGVLQALHDAGLLTPDDVAKAIANPRTITIRKNGAFEIAE